LLTLWATGTGCSELGRPGGGDRREPVRAEQISKEELREKLAQLEDNFEAVVERACDDLVAASGDRRTKKLTLLWQMRMFPMARNAVGQDDPVQGLLDVWTLCVRMANYLETGDGKSLFGASQPIAIAAAKECVAYAQRLAGLIMTKQMAADAQRSVQKLAAERPLRGEFTGSEIRIAQETGKGDDVLTTVLSIPLAPFKAFEGMDKGAAAIRGFTVVAAHLTDVVEGLASDARVQLELLLLEAEDLEAVKSALASFERLSKSSERLAAVAEKLPQDVRRELVGAFDAVDSKQAGVQTTLKEAKAAADQIQQASERLTAAGKAWEGTAKAITEMAEAFKSSPDHVAQPPSAVSPPEARPFDILDYAKTADAYYAAAKELTALADEIRKLSESNQFSQRATEVGTTVGSVTDHVAWRAVQLIFLIFVLSIGYWIVRRRLA
jgi:hypothetical protein